LTYTRFFYIFALVQRCLEGKMSLVDESCRDCKYLYEGFDLSGPVDLCEFYLIRGIHRGSPAGEGCKRYLKSAKSDRDKRRALQRRIYADVMRMRARGLRKNG